MSLESGKKPIDIPRAEYDLDFEIQELSSFLKKNDLLVPDNFLSLIAQNDIIEIYSFPGHRQIYANKEFSKISSYSQLQMQTLPFHELFWRSDESQIQLIERASQVAQQSQIAELWNVADHELIENLHPLKRTFEMKMGVIAPCFDKNFGARVAWASTLRVDFIFEWPEPA